MLFQEYEKLKRQYDYMQSICDQILKEKEFYFTKTQPSAIRYDKVSVTGGMHENGFDEYIEECQRHRVNERLNEAICILQARGELLSLKEQELRASKELLDIIYVMRFLDNAKVQTIAMALSYTETHIYRKIDEIRRMK